MLSKLVRAYALRVVYHIQQKLRELHGQPTRTLVMMVTAFLTAGVPCLSELGRKLPEIPGSLQKKVKRMSRFLCRSRFDVGQAFVRSGVRMLETIAHAHPKRAIAVAFDWTDLGDFMGLWLSIPYRGRALPLGCWVLEKELSEGGMTSVEQEMLRAFLDAMPEPLQRRIVILADRGFAKGELMRELSARGIHWVIRLPRNHKVLHEGAWTGLADLPLAPGETRVLHNVWLGKGTPIGVHVALRRMLPGEANDPEDDAWYLATDIYTHEQALRWYELRFQIEEMFRDLKSRFHIDRHRLGTEESVAKMMLVATLAYLVILEDGMQWRARISLDQIQKTTAWGVLSVFSVAKACFELFVPEAPPEVAEMIISCWSNRCAA